MTARALPKIGFIGSMNAMPMAYALKFKRDGYDVRYVVEAPPHDHLMRPEIHFGAEISYPYPEWIVEIPWGNDLVSHATAPWSNRAGVAAMRDRDIVFLNDSSIALAPSLPASTLCVALSSGSDIDLFGRWPVAFALASQIRRKYLYPVRLALELMRVLWQRRGLRRSDGVSYFPRGLNPTGDEVIDELRRRPRQPFLVERFDVNFKSSGVPRRPLPQRPLKKILVPVRFNMNPPPSGAFEYKGNDIILRGVAAYAKDNPSIELHLIDKGPPGDLAQARQMCRDLGIESNVTWHQPMPLAELFELYAQSDVIVDQVGHHWMGAVGCYALYMGRPLIANARLDIFGRLWGKDTPILQATTEGEIAQHLRRCEDMIERQRLAEAGQVFAEQYLDTESVYQKLRGAATDAWARRG
jgi:glycosyltransferase involved in cell wall biosynthesis